MQRLPAHMRCYRHAVDSVNHCVHRVFPDLQLKRCQLERDETDVALNSDFQR